MKEQILDIAEKLRLEIITEGEAKKLLLTLFNARVGFSGYCSKETLEGNRCDDLCDKSHCGY